MRKLFILITLATLSLYAQKTNHIASSDGTQIVFDCEGRGDLALVFVHGWCCNKDFWRCQTQHFSKKCTTIAIDMGGYGESGQRRTHSFQQWGDDIVAVIDSLNLKKVIIVGHSVGGYMVLNAATKLKDRVAAIVGADSYRGKLERSYTAEYAQEAAEGINENTFKDEMRDNERWFVPQSDPELKEWITEEMIDCPINTASEGLKAYYEYRNITLSEFEKVECPIFGINSEQSIFDLDFFESHRINFKPFYMSNVGHFIMMDDPERFNELLEKIIASVQ